MAPIPEEDCRWHVHRGVRVLVVDYGRCLTDEQMLTVLAEQVRLVQAEESRVRALHDYTDAVLGERYLEEAQRRSRERREAVFERVAIVGLTGIKKALFHVYRLATGDTTSRVFATRDAALDWLAS